MEPITSGTLMHRSSKMRPPLSAQAIADMAECRAALRTGSYTFYAASLLLPKAVREPASALYAFCRLADDAVDNATDNDTDNATDSVSCNRAQGGSDRGGGKHAAVARLRARLDAAYSGEALPVGSVAADRALAAVVSHFEIPRALLDALLEGFEWDANGKRYETVEDLQAYAARVAGAVGAMMAVLMGERRAEGLARACDLGVAMQLSNIARDVGEDARVGRLYLPQQWLREAGVDPQAWLRAPEFNPALATVVQRLLKVADGLYKQVGSGVADLPLACRPGINAARYLYAEIGHEVARRGLDSVNQRAMVSRARKVWLLAGALLNLIPHQPAQVAPCLPANQFLVDAVCLTPRAHPNDQTLRSSDRPARRASRRLADRVD